METIMKVEKDTTSYFYSLSNFYFLLSFAFDEKLPPHPFFFQLFKKQPQ